MSLAQRVAQAREHANLTQDELGKAVGVSQQTIQKLESGRTGSSRKLTEIALVCGVSAIWLATGRGPMHANLNASGSSSVPPVAPSHPLRPDPVLLDLAEEWTRTLEFIEKTQYGPAFRCRTFLDLYLRLLNGNGKMLDDDHEEVIQGAQTRREQREARGDGKPKGSA